MLHESHLIIQYIYQYLLYLISTNIRHIDNEHSNIFLENKV